WMSARHGFIDTKSVFCQRVLGDDHPWRIVVTGRTLHNIVFKPHTFWMASGRLGPDNGRRNCFDQIIGYQCIRRRYKSFFILARAYDNGLAAIDSRLSFDHGMFDLPIAVQRWVFPCIHKGKRCFEPLTCKRMHVVVKDLVILSYYPDATGSFFVIAYKIVTIYDGLVAMAQGQHPFAFEKEIIADDVVGRFIGDNLDFAITVDKYI